MVQKNSPDLPDPLPEVFVSSSATTKQVSRLVTGGKARKIGPRLYTSNLTDAPADIVFRNRWRVVELLVPNTVVGYRTAFEGHPAPDGSVYVVGPSRRTIGVPGLHIHVLRGPGPLEGDQPFLGSLYLASRPRALMESLTLTRERKYASRAVSRERIEEFLEGELRSGGEDRLNAIRDHAKRIAGALDTPEAARTLDGLVGTLLGTRRESLASPVTRARAAGLPYDPQRLALFSTLHAALLTWRGRTRADGPQAEHEFRNLAFFDAYFSNVIEGTEFKVEEAHAIVFDGKIPADRPADAHDVLATFRLVGSREWMRHGIRDVASADAYIARVQAAHAEIMAARPEVHPGEFKRVANQAGGTIFVEPDLVRGTLEQGLQLARSLDTAFARAAMVMFVVAEVHPFDDGNGRIARAFMNAELTSARERRVLVPTVFRNDYVTGLRTLSRSAYPDAFIAVLDHVQEYTARIDFTDYDQALAMLTQTNAFAVPETAIRVTAAPAVTEGEVKLRLPPPRPDP